MLTLAAKRAREHSSETSSSKERQEVEKTTVHEKEKKKESVREDPVNENEKVLSWMETAARAGVITMVTRTAEEESGVPQTMTQKTKKKTPKEYRQDGPKVKENTEITAIEKKKFKEMFLTDKSRLDKRQTSLNRPQNFLLIIEDNMHSKDSTKSATGGKFMAYGRGDLKDMFMREGLKYNAADFYMHANTTDFKEEVVRESPEVTKVAPGVVDKVPENGKTAAEKESRPLSKYDLYLEASRREAEAGSSSSDSSFL